ncbi:hypothetical protein [Brevibacillus porteri]|uniref:Uncharacterized protein n=1 Tax=Brevibacillus porteri TaxID=2126350 RepID=A0ABX5FPT4_9BACL|nr:hypothetical protein [Brevibacillus porteri]MED1802130.1 hypothetical protein [Brevibacillus porteri]MED2129700.1 hypothetical protein [Brevibacillus porteri]MED2743391.1 hypothetical protein [Brevibacillus porteri]MED2817668.1 hypothetical protein [Brevibacillus porteri]MED2897850.1 hypothetical protein [Brevibacillus porteri]
MKKQFLLSCLLATLLSSFFPGQTGAAIPTSQDPRKPDMVTIYHATPDGKTKKIQTNMPLIHRASISPSGRFVYGERIGYGKEDPTIPFLYDIQTKKLMQLSGIAKWSNKQDVLYIRENDGIVRLTTTDGKKTVLVPGIVQYPVLDFAISPDEQYLAFTRKDEKAADSKGSAHLYIQHLPTLQIKKHDQYEWRQDKAALEEKYYWMPNSKKLFYLTKEASKELDMSTGMKTDHKTTALPSYSSDMKYQYIKTEQEEYVLDLQTGKKNFLKVVEEYTAALRRILWSPIGHQFAAEQLLSWSSSQDNYMLMFVFNEPNKYGNPFGNHVNPGLLSTYMQDKDNYQLIGWAGDGKSFYFADLASIHIYDFGPGKLNWETYEFYEKR